MSTIVRFAFIDELLKLSKKLMLIDARMPVREADYVITGTVQSVELNTYGHGTKEGIGSAGDYWEARVVLTGVSVVRATDNATLWKGDITQYCKLQGSPVELNWTIFTVLAKSLQEGIAYSKGMTAEHVQEALDISAADYELAQTMQNPVEIAARLAALDVLKHIFKTKNGSDGHPALR